MQLRLWRMPLCVSFQGLFLMNNLRYPILFKTIFWPPLFILVLLIIKGGKFQIFYYLGMKPRLKSGNYNNLWNEPVDYVLIY